VIASVAGWGYEFARPLAEDSPPRPCGIPYIDTKGATETLALRRGATVIRPGDVYGRGSVPWVVRPLEMMRSGRFFLPAPGDGLITPVYVDDLVDAIVRALREPRAAGRAYTVWDGQAVTAREFFGFHARSLGHDRVRVLPAPLLRLAARAAGAGPAAVTFMQRRAVFPNARAREELGWEPRVSLAEGMARTLGDRT
jgi:nucleoside-diphosphate-sugar epimerase